MVKMLTSSIAFMSAAGDANLLRLGEIEKEISSASEMNDVRTIRMRLGDCLTDIRNEAARQRDSNLATIGQLSQGLKAVESSAGDLSEMPIFDPVTQLPSRRAAETALAEDGGSVFAVVFALERLQAINLKFGRQVGDEILNKFSGAIRKKMPPSDRLFRWSGPVLLAILSRPGSIESVRGEVACIAEGNLEYIIETSTRSVLIPIAAQWSVFPKTAATHLLCQRIDAFTTARAR